MDPEEFKQMSKEVEPFLENDRFTLKSEAKWLELKGIVTILDQDTGMFAIKEDKVPQFHLFAKKIQQFYYMRAKNKAAKMGVGYR